MSSGYEKSVKGATKIKLAPPKSKYIEHILISTHAGEAGVAEVFRALQNRLRDSTWTVVFKALIVVHLMIREGQEDVTLNYLSNNPQRKLAISNFTEVQHQGRNIRHYEEYLIQRAVTFATTNRDYVRNGEGRLKKLTIDKGLLRETEAVQEQIKYLLRCEFFHPPETENEITLTAFRLLTMDLLALFHVMNEGTINVLENFFKMSRPDAERALKIYRLFVKQTDLVVRYLSIARHYEHATRLEIPKIKHAPTGLSTSLEEYVKDADFEINRRQYLAQQDAKKNDKNGVSTSTTKKPDTNGTASKPTVTQAAAKEAPKGPAPDLIDFFASIEQNQQPMPQPTFQQGQMLPQMTAQQYQTNPFLQQQQQQQQQPIPQGVPQQALHNTNPFLQMSQQGPPMQPQFTGTPVGFAPQLAQQQQPGPSRFQPTLQSVPQAAPASFQPSIQQPFQTGSTVSSVPASTNPFRQSMIASSVTGSTNTSFTSAPSPFTSQPTGGNPFARPPSLASPASSFGGPSPFGQSSPFSPNPPSNSSTPPAMMPQATGTNPFAKPVAPTSNPFGAPTPIAANPTGSTNPFRQSQFVNQATGTGWQNSADQGTIGGFQSNQLDTVPIFPRPGGMSS